MNSQDEIQSEVELKLRNIRLEDFDDISQVMNRVYDRLGGVWPKENFVAILKTFREG